MVHNAVVMVVVLAISLGCAMHREIATPAAVEAHSHIWALARCFDDAAGSYSRLGVTWHNCIYHEMDRSGSRRVIWSHDPDLGAQIDMIIYRLQQRTYEIYSVRLHAAVAEYRIANAIRVASDELRGLIPEPYAAP